MRVIVIDTKAKTVEEAQLDGSDSKTRYTTLKALMRDVWLEGVRIADGEVLYVDEEFLIKPEAKTETEWFLMTPHGPIVGHPQPMTGVAVVTGVDEEGDTCETRLTLEQVRASVRFVRATFDGFTVRTDTVELMGQPATRITQQGHFTPIPDAKEQH